MLKFWRQCIWLFFLSAFIWQVFQNREVHVRFFDQRGKEHLLCLPHKDRKRLLIFMRHLFASDSFAYTAVGAKPLSWASYQTVSKLRSWSIFPSSSKKFNQSMQVGWKTWGKYSHLFPERALFMEKSGDSRSIFIVNQEKFNSIVLENKDDFERILNRKIDNGYQLLEEAEKTSLIEEVLKHHQALIGMALGYGRKNSWNFHEKALVRAPLPWPYVWGEEDPEDGDKEIESCKDLNEILLHIFSCPTFSGDPDSDESKFLKQSYLQARKIVLEYYKGQDFLEATLSLLAGKKIDPSFASEPGL